MLVICQMNCKVYIRLHFVINVITRKDNKWFKNVLFLQGSWYNFFTLQEVSTLAGTYYWLFSKTIFSYFPLLLSSKTLSEKFFDKHILFYKDESSPRSTWPILLLCQSDRTNFILWNIIFRISLNGGAWFVICVFRVRDKLKLISTIKLKLNHKTKVQQLNEMEMGKICFARDEKSRTLYHRYLTIMITLNHKKTL